MYLFIQFLVLDLIFSFCPLIADCFMLPSSPRKKWYKKLLAVISSNFSLIALDDEEKNK